MLLKEYGRERVNNMEIKQIKINGTVYQLPHNVQGDWDEHNPNIKSFIHNKPFYKYEYTDVAQFTRENILPYSPNCVTTEDNVCVKPGDIASITLYATDDECVLEATDIDVVNMLPNLDIDFDGDHIYGIQYSNSAKYLDMTVLFGVKMNDTGECVPGKGCICLFDKAPQEYTEILARVVITIAGTEFKPLDNEFIQTSSKFNVDDDSPVNSKAIDDAFTQKIKPTEYNTPYDAETNKAATMADIENAVADVENALDGITDELDGINDAIESLTVEYNTPYNKDTNKVATMADIENALFVDEEELV
jgi:hypothetical protein